MALAIKVRKIEDGELRGDIGYKWETDLKTRQEFEDKRKFDVGYGEGRICLDLIDIDKENVEDTITITQEKFQELTGRKTTFVGEDE